MRAHRASVRLYTERHEGLTAERSKSEIEPSCSRGGAMMANVAEKTKAKARSRDTTIVCFGRNKNHFDLEEERSED